MSSRPKFCDLAGSIFLSHNMLEDQTLSHFESIYSKNKWYSILVYRRRTHYVQHANIVGCIISPCTILTLDTTIRRAARVIRTSKQLWIIMSCDALKWNQFLYPFTWWYSGLENQNSFHFLIVGCTFFARSCFKLKNMTRKLGLLKQPLLTTP